MPATKTATRQGEGNEMSTATARKENGHGYEIVPAIPKPETKLFDAQGKTVEPAHPTLMARLNEKSKDEFTITKGMAAIVAICLTAVGLFLGYIIPEVRQGARESEKILTIESEVKQTREDMKALNTKFEEIQKSLQEQALKDAETKGREYGYNVGRTDKQGGH